MEEFEWFDPQIGTPMVSVAGYGLTFNRAAVELLSRPAKVALGFSKTRKAIAVKPLADEEDDVGAHGLEFNRRERNGYVRISSKDFVRFVARYCPDVDFSRTVRYLAYWDEKAGVMLVDLEHPVDINADDEQTKDPER